MLLFVVQGTKIHSHADENDFVEVKKINNKLMYVSVNLNQSKNFFAITKELCYNIKKVRYFGKGLPIYSLLKNAGLVVGALIFIAVAIVSNDYVLSIDFSGSGSVCHKRSSAIPIRTRCNRKEQIFVFFA